MERQAENLFHAVADLPAEQREAYYLRQHVPGEMKAEVEELLRFDGGAEEELLDCVAHHAEQFAHGTVQPQVGARCGPYYLTRLLGLGGMGSVYLGERADGEVRQRVAVKLLRYGGREHWFKERFLRERQILATLNHSGIAHLLDAGHTAEGQPYLAMDYIDGTPIDVFARDLDLRAKVLLFLQVCDAVSYAHRNLIVHRDLKPSNILVTSTGEAKLLDFGIAKILDETFELNVDQTGTRELLLTPDYASPEQVRGEARTTATDIYSLGAVLYALLTGRSPHAFSKEPSCRESGNRIEEAICHRDTQAPSKLNREIPKDLDYILAKVLRKEPLERYASVDAFARDLRAFLEWRPIEARSGNTWYRTRKFLVRYRLGVLVTAVTLAALSIGLVLANREREIAQHRFRQVRQLANRTLALDLELRVLPGTTKARSEIVAMSQEYLEGLRAAARGDEQLALETAQGYIQLAHIQGVPTDSNLGRYQDAEVSLRKADALLQPILQASPRNTAALLAAAKAAQGLMILADETHRKEDAVAQAATMVARVEEFLATPGVTRIGASEAARLITNVALFDKNIHHWADSIRYSRRAVAIALLGDDQDREIANALSVMADSMRSSGDLDGALAAILEAQTRIERSVFPGENIRRYNMFNVLWREGVILGTDATISLDRPAEAIVVLQRVFDLMELGAEQDPHDSKSRMLITKAARELGPLLERGDPRAALAVFDKALERVRDVKHNPSARNDEGVILARSASTLRRLGRPDESRQRLDAALRLLRESKSYPAKQIDPASDAEFIVAAWADHFAETGQTERGIEAYRSLLVQVQAYPSDVENDVINANRLSLIYRALAALDRRAGNRDEADSLDGLRVQLWQGWTHKLPGNPFVKRQLADASAGK